MRIWSDLGGKRPNDVVPFGDVYKTYGDCYYLRVRNRAGKLDWQQISRERLRALLDDDWDRSREYLRESFGLSEDVEL